MTHDIHTSIGTLTVTISEWYGDRYAYQGDRAELFGYVYLNAPDLDDAGSLADGCDIETRRDRFDAETAPQYAALVDYVAALAEAIDKGNEGQAEEARRIEAEEEKQREQAEKARLATIAVRKERLLTEFMGETVKVREYGYKTARVATVEALQKERYDYDKRQYVKDEEWTIHFAYRGDERTQRIERIRRLDIKVGSEWQTVWDDGTDDVWGDLARSAKPTGKMYDQMQERI